MAFHEIRLDVKHAYGATGGTQYNSLVVKAPSKFEQRFQLSEGGYYEGSIDFKDKTRTQMEELDRFFRGRRGIVYGFRFKNWDDYTAEDEDVVAVDGMHGLLYKNYADVVNPEQKRIWKPVAGTVTLKRNGVAWASGGNWTLDTTTGELTYNADQTGQDITWSGEFDLPVRFDMKGLNTNQTNFNLWDLDSVDIVELVFPNA
jgi:uncharacterized protein (TIGR02217 family)